MTTQTTARRSFTYEFKREAVLLLASSGRPLTQVAIELGIQPSMLRSWRGKVNGISLQVAGGVSSAAVAASAEQSEIRRLRRDLERAQMERDILKKGHRHLLGPAEMRFCFIEDRRNAYPVRTLCAVLKVSPSGYYAWRDRPESARHVADRGLTAEIRRIHADTRAVYGSPRVHAALRAGGRRVGGNRVARLMRHHGIQGRHKRRAPRTTDSHHSHPIAANLLDRPFTAAAPNRVWLADIPYIPTREGWLYLAVVLDMFSRRMVGWAMRDERDDATRVGD